MNERSSAGGGQPASPEPVAPEAPPLDAQVSDALLIDVQVSDEQSRRDRAFMRLAIDQAHNAWTVGEVPVGAVLVRNGQVLATGYNQPIGAHDPTAHAEIRAMRAAAQMVGNYRLVDCDLYVTLEPCAMCAGAIMHARIRRLVYGARDPKTGACGSVVDLLGVEKLNHHTSVTGGVMGEDTGRLLSDFFAERRRRVREAAAALKSWKDAAAKAPS